MPLNYLDFTHFKAFFTISQLPIRIISEEGKLSGQYDQEAHFFPYTTIPSFIYKEQKDSSQILTIQGLLGESFLFFYFKQHYIFLGPFFTGKLSKSNQEKILKNYTLTQPKSKQEELISYLSTIKIIPTEAIRDYLMTLDALLGTRFEKNITPDILQIGDMGAQTPVSSCSTKGAAVAQTLEVLDYIDEVVKIVRLGNPALLEAERKHLIPSVGSQASLESLQLEKYINTIYLSKLYDCSRLEGKERDQSLQLFYQFMTETDQAENLIAVLQVRQKALLTFAQHFSQPATSAKAKLFQQALQMVDDNLYSSLKIADVAQELGISESYLRKIFKEKVGTTMMEYLLQQKVNEAKKLLQQGKSIPEIVENLAFYDKSHFFKTFKKYAGLTPKQYLKQAQ